LRVEENKTLIMLTPDLQMVQTLSPLSDDSKESNSIYGKRNKARKKTSVSAPGFS
jgi:hypothetical protein